MAAAADPAANLVGSLGEDSGDAASTQWERIARLEQDLSASRIRVGCPQARGCCRAVPNPGVGVLLDDTLLKGARRAAPSSSSTQADVLVQMSARDRRTRESWSAWRVTWAATAGGIAGACTAATACWE
jgi:hypothetical protein